MHRRWSAILRRGDKARGVIAKRSCRLSPAGQNRERCMHLNLYSDDMHLPAHTAMNTQPGRITQKSLISPDIIYALKDGLPSVTPTRRDLSFDLPADRVTDWYENCAPGTHFFSAMSIATPLVERYIILGVRHYRDRLDDPQLVAQIDGLVAQEAIHTREHRRYNALLQAAGIPVAELEQWWDRLLNLTHARFVPAWFRLATIMMLEHHTAAASAKLLERPEIFAGSVEGYKDLLTWHSLEETEHKSVSFDVWRQVVKPGWRQYVYRTFTTLVISPPFWITFYSTLIRVLYADRISKKSLYGYWRLFRLLFGVRGLISSNAWVWIQYFLPGYHPWNDDNSEALARAMKEMVEGRQRPSNKT